MAARASDEGTSERVTAQGYRDAIGALHWKRNHKASMRPRRTQAHTGNPPTMRVAWGCFLGCGLGNSVLQRQHLILSSGFQVPQLGHFMGQSSQATPIKMA